MELRGRAETPWPIPPARTPLAIEARLLDSDVHSLLRTEELAGNEPVSGPQLQRATHAEFPSNVRVLELNCCAILLTAAGSGGIFAILANAVAGLDLGTQGRREAKPSFPSQKDRQELHILPTLARWCSSRMLPTSRASWILSPKFQRGPSDSRQTDGNHIQRRWSDLLHGTRDAAESIEAVCCLLPAPRKKKNTQA